MTNLLLVMLGGSIGASLRYLTWLLIHRNYSGRWPWGTMAANLTGCFLIGLTWTLADELLISPEIINFLMIGIFGSLTTFSTYSLESINLIRDGDLKTALYYLGVSNIAGVLLVFAGFAFGGFWVN